MADTETEDWYDVDITKVTGCKEAGTKTGAKCEPCNKVLADSCAKSVIGHRRYELRGSVFEK